MGSPDLFRALTRSLKGGRARKVAPDDIRLTPYLSVVIAILYMMAADGDISDRESSQLQSVIGADADTLHRAVAYAETRSVDQFLQDAPPVLDAKSRLCLLMNVCDSLMADGELSATELQLFDRLVGALGHTKESFQSYFDAIALKNRMSILGDFDAAASSSDMTPPKAMVVSLLYMMSADGSMGEEEIGRLNAVVGGSQALLKAGLRYVGQVRAPQFLAAAAGVLDEQQRMCILLNACDTMMSDHQVAGGERDLFRRMLAAFGIAPGKFDRYLNVIYLKNDLPQDERRPVSRSRSTESAQPVIQSRARGRHQGEGVVFERKRQWEEEGGDAGDADPEARRKARAAKRDGTPQSELDARISRAMQENLDRMSDEFQGGGTFDAVARNSRTGVQSGDDGADDDGPTDLRAFREAGFSNSKDHVAESGHAGEGRHWKDGEGDADRRAMRDSDGATDSNGRQRGGTSVPGHHWKDADGSADGRAMQDAGTPRDPRALRDTDGNSNGRTPRDADRDRDGRAMRDADRDRDGRALRDAEGDSDGRTMRDADGTGDGRAMRDAEGASDGRAMRDAKEHNGDEGRRDRGGVFGKSALQDADADFSQSGMDDSGAGTPGRNWRDAATPGGGEALRDADAPPSGTPIVDDRRSFDADADEDDEGPVSTDPIVGRMDSVSDRTKTIQAHLEAMGAARSIAAANRLPRLPEGPAVRRRLPDAAVAADSATSVGRVQLDTAGDNAGIDDMDSDDVSGMLLASDEGGPILNDNPTTASAEQAQQNRKLRQWSAVLLPALFVTYGTTMVGETSAERTFITSENMATDARVVHQMASVQQTVYRIAPDAVSLAPSSVLPSMTSGAASGAASGVAGSAGAAGAAGAAGGAGTAAGAAATTTAATGAGSAAGTAAAAATAGGATAITAASHVSGGPAAVGDGEAAIPSDRAQADSFLERRKEELQAMFKRHQSASAVAAERKQWFVYAKSVVLLGLGMAFWGVLFRSMRMLQGSTAAGLIGLLLTANGYWLFMHF